MALSRISFRRAFASARESCVFLLESYLPHEPFTPLDAGDIASGVDFVDASVIALYTAVFEFTLHEIRYKWDDGIHYLNDLPSGLSKSQ